MTCPPDGWEPRAHLGSVKVDPRRKPHGRCPAEHGGDGLLLWCELDEGHEGPHMQTYRWGPR